MARSDCEGTVCLVAQKRDTLESGGLCGRSAQESPKQQRMQGRNNSSRKQALPDGHSGEGLKVNT